MAAVVAPGSAWIAALVVLLLGVAAAIGRVGTVLRGWRTVAPVCLSLLIVYSWALPGSTEYVWVFGVQGFIAALLIVTRLLAFVTALHVLLASTGPLALVEWSGDVNEDLGVMVALSLGVIPAMKQQLDVTLEAQVARGLNLGKSVFGRVRAYLTILIPVVVKSLVRAQGMAALLRVRGHGSGRRFVERPTWTLPVIATYALGAGILIAMAAARVWTRG